MKKPTRTRSPEIRPVTVPRLEHVRGGASDDWEAPMTTRRKVSAADDWQQPVV